MQGNVPRIEPRKVSGRYPREMPNERCPRVVSTEPIAKIGKRECERESIKENRLCYCNLSGFFFRIILGYFWGLLCIYHRNSGKTHDNFR